MALSPLVLAGTGCWDGSDSGANLLLTGMVYREPLSAGGGDMRLEAWMVLFSVS